MVVNVTDVAMRPIAWMAWLFIMGSACFAVGVPLSLVTTISPVVAAAVFFVGSILFTAAASIQTLAGPHDTSAGRNRCKPVVARSPIV